jgi:hypothetical protein
MIFILPIVLGAAAVATAAAGVAKGVDGVSKMKEAKRIGREAKRKYKRARRKVKEELEVTQKLAANYGQLQLQVKQHTIGRFVSFIEQIGQSASQSDMQYLETLEGASPKQIKEYQSAQLEAEELAKGGAAAVGTAYAAGQGTLALVGLFGTASTGAVINGLSGAAAWNATLACLGGGSLAAGGGGMALGAMVLGGITVAPALMIGGLVLSGQGEKALTKASKYRKKVKTQVAQLEAFEDFLEKIRRRIRELRSLIKALNAKATEGLEELESRPFDRKRDAAKFQQVALLIKAISEIMKIPILDEKGNLNSGWSRIREKYRKM